MTADGRPITAVGGQPSTARGQVQCRSEHEYAQRPIAFHWAGECQEIREIINSWRHPDGKRFHVRTSSDMIFELRYHEVKNEWIIQQL